jgi:integrase
MQDQPNLSPYKRFKTSTPGLTYRLRADGRSKTWYASAGDGRHVRCGTRDEALEMLERLRGAKRRGERVAVNDRTTFAELAEQWLESKKASGRRPLRRSTSDRYRRALDLVLIPRFGKWRVSAIDAEAIAQLVRDLERDGLHTLDRSRTKKPLGESSILNYLKPLQGTLKLAVRRRLISASPFEHLTDDDRPLSAEKEQPHEWTQKELAALLAASETIARRPTSKYDYTPLLRLTERLGLRLGEVLGLQWNDFNYNEATLRVERQWTRFGEYGPTKTRAGVRTLYLPDDLREMLRGLWVEAAPYEHDEDPIFASRAGTPLGHRNVTRRGYEPAAKLAGLEDVSFHDLRHAAASRLIAARLDDELIADQLGHEDSTITRRVYAHVYDRAKKADAVREALGGGAS